MTWRMPRVRSWLRWTPGGSRVSSRVLVSVYVQNAMHPRGLSSRSRRILLTTSIWSLVILVLAFFVTYTVLLVYVDHPFQTFHSASSLDGSSPHQLRPKIRFHGRVFGGSGRRNGSSLVFSPDAEHRQKVWDAASLDAPESSLPECKHGSLFIIIITSSPGHFEHRQQIRNSWCDPSLSNHDINSWQCVFLIGKTDSPDLDSQLEEEGTQYKDLLRGSYIDSYRNLTYKVMHGMAWVSTRCEAPYVLKTDDDCFVSTHLLWQFLMHHNKQTSSLYAGHMVLDPNKREVIRDPTQKWSVAVEDYRPKTYPLYASGSGYALSFDVVTKAVEESRVVKPIPNEDAYIGILLDRLGIPPTVSGRFILSSAGLRLCNYMYMFVVHGVEPNMHRDMHKKVMMSQIRCTKEEETTDWF